MYRNRGGGADYGCTAIPNSAADALDTTQLE